MWNFRARTKIQRKMKMNRGAVPAVHTPAMFRKGSYMFAASILIGLSAFAAGSDPDFEAFFEEFTAKRAEVNSLEATFKQTNINPNETYESTGAIQYAQPRQLLFSYNEPDRQEILFNADRLYEYDVELAQLVVRDIADLQEVETLFLAFENNPERLRALYKVAVAFPPEDREKGCNGRVIILTPNVEEDEPALFQRVELFLRDEDYLPCRVYVVNDNDSEFYIDIDYGTIGGGSQDVTLNFELDKDVTIVVDERVHSVTQEPGTVVPGDIGTGAAVTGDSDEERP